MFIKKQEERRHAQQFSFWRRSAAVTAASSNGVSPFAARRGGDAPWTRRRDACATSKWELLQASVLFCFCAGSKTIDWNVSC